MTNELSIITALKNVIETDLPQYLTSFDESLDTDYGVLIDYPEVDQMPKKNMFYLVPDVASFENQASESDEARFQVQIYFLCKRDTWNNLMLKGYGYVKALYETLRHNMTLGGVVDFTDIVQSIYYYSIDGDRDVQGAEVEVVARYTKDF